VLGREGEGGSMQEPQGNFCSPSDGSWRCCYIGKGVEKKGGKWGGKEFKFPPKSAALRIQNLGGNRIHFCKVPGERIMAGRFPRV